MNTLSDIQEKLQHTEIALALAEKQFTNSPDPTLLITLKSLGKRREKLEEMLLKVTATESQEVCLNNTILPESSR